VAERAGVSIGSVYQYFPNKASILFQLQLEEWQRTTTLLREILQDTRYPPFQRMRTLVLALCARSVKRRRCAPRWMTPRPCIAMRLR
jgi:AcrR family transcriptional regulator